MEAEPVLVGRPSFGARLLIPPRRARHLGEASNMNSLRNAALMVGTLSLSACTAAPTAPDVGPLLDTARPPYVNQDSGARLTGYLQVRLANLSPAAPNLTICLSTVAGTGAPETTGRILGQPDPAAGVDGTLPFPGVSPYVPVPIYDTPGFGYVMRLYSRDDLPFALGGACPAPESAIMPLFTASLTTADLSGVTHATVIAAGVLPGTPVSCPGTCPEPQIIVIPDDPTPNPEGARVRLVHAIPNVPVPIEVCLDPDEVINLGAGMFSNGPLPRMRVLPEASDTNGMVFGDTSEFIETVPLRNSGVLYVHAVTTGVPSCNAATQILGPYPFPLPVPSGTPADVARTLDAGDVITAFAFGRAGNPCTDDAMCIEALGGDCDTTTGMCEDDLSPSVLPWQDVRGPME